MLGAGLTVWPQAGAPSQGWTPADLFGPGDVGLYLDSEDVAAGSGRVLSWPSRAGGWSAPTQTDPTYAPYQGGAAWSDGVPTVATTGFEGLPYAPPLNWFVAGVPYTALWVGRITGFNLAYLFSGSGTQQNHRLWLNGSPAYKLQSRQRNQTGTTVSHVGPAWVRDTQTMAAWNIVGDGTGRYSVNGSPWGAPATWFPTGTFTPTKHELLAWTDDSGSPQGFTRALVVISRPLSDSELATLATHYATP